jgi:hypothetical protein
MLCNCYLLPSVIVHYFNMFSSAVNYLNIQFDVSIVLERVLSALARASQIIFLPIEWFGCFDFQIKVCISSPSLYCQL